MTWCYIDWTGAEWWDLVPAIVGALAGAAAAFIPAYFFARKSSRETLERDRVSRLEQQKAATFRALVKLQIIVNGISDTHRQLEEMISAADSAGLQDQSLWQKVTPMIGFSVAPVRFEAEEVTVFIGKESDYLNELLLLAERYDSMIVTFKAYSDRRERLTEQFSAVMNGLVGSTWLDAEVHAKFASTITALDTLIIQLRDNLASDYKMALSVAGKFGPKARTQLNDPSFPLLSTEEAEHANNKAMP